MRNYFIFGEYDSRDFGVYISGEGTYDAPARVYNAISVPGRNGDLLIDEGKYENIALKYPAFIAGDNFRENLAAFRSAMLSVKGYARLVDTYHPDEYRRAYFGDEITVKARKQNDAGQFDIIFTCDPRRFLISGEDIITYPPGDIGKNMLPYPYSESSSVQQGVTVTDNGDGTIKLNGSNPQYAFSHYLLGSSVTGVSIPALENGETYILNGCPAGGAFNTYSIRVQVKTSTTREFSDLGDGVSFTYDSSAEYKIRIFVNSGCSFNNVTFYPMIRKASDPDGWEPYYIWSRNVLNPTLFTSKPVIKVIPSSGYIPSTDHVITIGDQQITLRNILPYVIINSEIEDCYCETANLNSQVTFSKGKFPELKPGLNAFDKPTSISSVEITPNWYRL